MCSRWSYSCLVLILCASIGSAEEASVPPPPANGDAEITPSKIFNEGAEQTPIVDMTTPSQSQTVYTVSSYGQPANGDVPFATFTGGVSVPIDGPIDKLFNGGSLFSFEVGQQFELEGGTIALTIGLANQTYFGRDNTDVTVVGGGPSYNVDTLSITTVKTGLYLGRKLGDFDLYAGIYAKAGMALLGEDTTPFNPAHRNVLVNRIRTEAFAGGTGAEAGLNFYQGDRATFGLVGGMDFLYLDSFAGVDKWNAYIHAGLTASFDITDGLFPDRPTRCERRQARQCRRMNRRRR